MEDDVINDQPKVRKPIVKKNMVQKIVKMYSPDGFEIQKKKKKSKLPVAEQDIRKLLAASTPQMALALINMALDENISPRERLAAIKYSMDRCFGTPKEHIVVDQKVDSFTSALIDMTKLYEQLNQQPVLDGKIDSFNSQGDVIDCPLDSEPTTLEASLHNVMAAVGDDMPMMNEASSSQSLDTPSQDCPTSSADMVGDDSQNPTNHHTLDDSSKTIPNHDSTIQPTIPFTIPLNDTTINRHNRNIRQLERAVKEELKARVKNSIK